VSDFGNNSSNFSTQQINILQNAKYDNFSTGQKWPNKTAESLNQLLQYMWAAQIQTRSMFARLWKVCDTSERTHQDVAWMKAAVVETLASLIHVNATERSLYNATNSHWPTAIQLPSQRQQKTGLTTT